MSPKSANSDRNRSICAFSFASLLLPLLLFVTRLLCAGNSFACSSSRKNAFRDIGGDWSNFSFFVAFALPPPPPCCCCCCCCCCCLFGIGGTSNMLLCAFALFLFPPAPCEYCKHACGRLPALLIVNGCEDSLGVNCICCEDSC